MTIGNLTATWTSEDSRYQVGGYVRNFTDEDRILYENISTNGINVTVIPWLANPPITRHRPAMDFSTLFSAFGLASAAGFNAYIPLLAVGLTARYTELLKLSEPFDVLTHPWVLIAIAVLAVIDFAADKIPAVDSVWHAVGLLIAPLAGAVLFASQHNVLSDLHPLLAALAGLIIAGGFHGSRAAVRPVSTATTGGAMNPVLSFMEDFLAAGLSLFALFLPGLAILLVIVVLISVILIGAQAWKHRPNRHGARRQSSP